MCKSVVATLGNVMAAIEPTLVSVETATGIINTAAGQDSIAAYKAALAAVEAWVPGTTSQDVVQVIGAFTQVFDVLPFPPEVELLVNTISAGIVVVINILAANSPAPAGTVAAAHQEAVAADAQARVAVLLPGFREGWFTRTKAAMGDTNAVAGAYKSEWNRNVAKVAAVEPKYATLQLA
jgi:hypothetical protein